MFEERSFVETANVYHEFKDRNPTSSRVAVEAFPYPEDLNQHDNPTDLFRGYLGFFEMLMIRIFEIRIDCESRVVILRERETPWGYAHGI